jgi:nucleotide-binding universal stress UspA family protein
MADRRRILVPVDFAVDCRPAFDWAVDYCAHVPGHIALMHVIDADKQVWDVLAREYSAERLREQIEGEVWSELSAFLDTHPQVPAPEDIETVVRFGHPAEEILAEARRGKADLIVMCARGPRPMVTHLLGGVTDKVVRAAPCPVVVIPYQERGEPRVK